MLSRFFDQLDIISIYFNISYFNFSDTRKKSFKLASKDITSFIHSFVQLRIEQVSLFCTRFLRISQKLEKLLCRVAAFNECA